LPPFKVIGQPVARPDGVDKVTGAGRYTADHPLPGVLWGKTLHSPYAHARILRIDTSAARQVPGVHAVLTAADVADGPWGRAIKDVPILASDRVRFFGERIVAVAADDEDIAQQALDLVVIDYEELPAVFDPDEAVAEGAPLLHPDYGAYPGTRPLDKPSNAYSTAVNERGDVEAGFAAADVIVENTYTTQRQHHAYLETQSVMVNIDGDNVQVWTCAKAPYDARASLAHAIEVPADQVVINHSYIGGDFGGKATPHALPICYFLAKATGRPVRMVNEYLEEFMEGNPRHSTVLRLRTGVKNDGTITAHEAEAFVNTGAYAGYKPLGIIGGAVRSAMAGPYRIPAVRLASSEVYTNTVPCGHMRSPGEPQGAFAIESHMDEVARRIGMDPFDFRLKNIIVDGDETPMGAVHHDLRGRETLDAAAEAAGYHNRRPVNRGMGIAMCDRAPVGGVGTLEVTLQPDGGIALGTPIFDQGTGTYATHRQVIAEEFGVDPARISFQPWPTGAVAYDSGIGGMRATRVNTIVSYEAAQDTKRALLELAADYLGWPSETLVFRDGEVRRTDQEEAIAWPDLLRQANTTVTGRGEVNEQGRTEVTCFAAQIAEVEVDPETGEVRLINFTTAHDTGQIVNPIGHQGQINGGLVQGIGYGLMEELLVEEGRVTTLSFGDYKIPTIADLPRLKTVVLEPGEGVGPYNIKGIGETPNTPTAAAIANAVEDAIGVRIRDLPVTSEKVYRALREREGA
jgi:CO/xanthine dehydrogenase Mo-binding subunit